jgi:DNA adenine methylase
MAKERSYSECINDLDGEIINVFKVLREPDTALELQRLLELTPFARTEFEEAYLPSHEPVEQARRTVIKAFMGFGSAAITATTTRKLWFRAKRSTPTGFRANSNRSGSTPAHDWVNWPRYIPGFVERLQGVFIENKDATAVMLQHDSERTLHYVDPPYVHGTRQQRSHTPEPHEYRHEMTDDDHRALSEVLHSLKGFVVLSGYPSALYDELFEGWTCVTKDAHADGARDRVECLWINRASDSPALQLFG